MPDLHLAKQQPCKVLLWQIVGWRSSVQMYRRRFLLRADFQRQQGFQFCLLVMLQPMLGALLESANPFAQSHHSSYCAPGSLMKLYEAYIVWFTSFFTFFRSFTQPSSQFQPSVHRVVDICAGYVPFKKNRPAQCRDRCVLHSGTLWHFLRDITHMTTILHLWNTNLDPSGSFLPAEVCMKMLWATFHTCTQALWIGDKNSQIWHGPLRSAICDLNIVALWRFESEVVAMQSHFVGAAFPKKFGAQIFGLQKPWRMVTAYFPERTCSNLSMISMISM